MPFPCFLISGFGCMCIMHINYHFDAVLVLHTRTALLVDAMEVQTQCRGPAPTEIWYWSRGVCWRWVVAPPLGVGGWCWLGYRLHI
jgi:hypothetical protein